MRVSSARLLRIILFAALVWIVDWICFQLGVSRDTAGMALLLTVLATATRGDWWLAIVTVGSACLAFNYFHIDDIGSLAIRTLDGAVTFTALVVTAVTGSHLAIRARHRADEAERRREEMDRLQQLGGSLLAPNTLAELGQVLVNRVVELFGAKTSVLRVEGQEFLAGETPTGDPVQLRIKTGKENVVLSLYGVRPSTEVTDALSHLVDLALDRARASEDRARMESAGRGEQLRNTVLNALAHNFKTPLTCIKAAASMLRRSSSVSCEARRDLIIAIDEEADRLAKLIGDSLDLAHIEAHRMSPRDERCDVRSLLRKIVEHTSRYLGGRGVTLEIPENLPPVCGDQFLLEQMFTQIIDNAWKYSQPGAAIRIEARTASQRVLVTIQNEGRPIPEDENERIFDRFYRGAWHRCTIEGTGLGLPIARSIAQVHGGALWLDQEPGGPAFRFLLPVATITPSREREKHLDPEPHYIVG